MDGGKVVRGSRDQVARYRRVLWRSLVVLQQPVDYLTPRCSRSTTTAPRPGSPRSNASDQFPSASCGDGNRGRSTGETRLVGHSAPKIPHDWPREPIPVAYVRVGLSLWVARQMDLPTTGVTKPIPAPRLP